MTYNSWEDIYKEKESEVLYKICKGFNHPTYEQKELALKILKERKFDFDKAEQRLKSWEATKRNQQRAIERKHPILSYLINKRGFIIALVSGVLLVILLVEISRIKLEGVYYEVRLPLVGFIGALVIAILFGLVLQLLINRKRTS